MKNENSATDFERKFLDCDNKFQTICDLTSTASKVIGSDLTILKVNHALINLLGYSAREMEGTKILEYACEEYLDHWLQLQHELWAKKVPFFTLEACLYHKDRSLVWVKVTTILYKDEGETFGFTVLDDITALKDFQQAETRLSRALRYSKAAVWELDLKDQSVFRSQGHDEIFGYPTHQKTWDMERYASHILEEDLAGFNRAAALLMNGEHIDLQVRLKNEQGPIKWINFLGTVEKDSDAIPAKVLGVVKDITMDKLIEGHKDDFISIASHELKTPITSLKAYLQILDKTKDQLPPSAQTMISKANSSLEKIVTLIEDLLNAGKTYQQQLALKKSRVNLYQIAKECIEQVNHSNPSAEVLLSGQLEVWVNVDAERVGRVIINLLNNAIKYAAASRKILVELKKVGDMAQLSVSDQGPGISPDKIPLLFDRYYQVSPKEYSGLGLGLFISAEIIRRHAGDIWVESKVGIGSTFHFTIPI